MDEFNAWMMPSCTNGIRSVTFHLEIVIPFENLEQVRCTWDKLIF